MASSTDTFELSGATAVQRTALEIVPDAADFEFFRPLFGYWADRRRGRVAPSRADIDPVDLPAALLPHLLLIDVERDPLDFRYRLAGTAADHIHGMRLRGVRVLDLEPEPFAKILQADLMRMAQDLEPQYLRHDFINREAVSRRFRVLRLPLSDDGERLDIVLVLAEFGALGR